MKRIQINHNVVNKKMIKEIKYSLISYMKLLLLVVIGIVCWLLGAKSIQQESFFIGIILILLGSFSLGWLFHSYSEEYQGLMDNFKDVEDIVYTMLFGTNGVSVQNCYLGTNTKIDYAHMLRMIETKNTYTIFAKEGQLIMIRKDCLKVTPQQFMDFLKSKDTKIKRWPKV